MSLPVDDHNAGVASWTTCLARSIQRVREVSSFGGTGSAAGGGAAATKVPTPRRRTTSPRCSSSANALTTVFGLTDSASTTSFTLGS